MDVGGSQETEDDRQEDQGMEETKENHQEEDLEGGCDNGPSGIGYLTQLQTKLGYTFKNCL